MNGAREFASLFKTGIYGKLYLESGSHARGKTFRIFVLPDNFNPDDNIYNNSVVVYGIIGGQSGWTEYYGWIHKGPWQDDFKKLISDRKEEIESKKSIAEKKSRNAEDVKKKRVKSILEQY